MTARIVIPTRAKASKYRAVRAEHGGRAYDSKAEANRAAELDMLKRAGEIEWWLAQVPVMVGDPGVDRPFKVDFLVGSIDEIDGIEYLRVHAEDVKGLDLPRFRRTCKQWRLRGPFDLHVLRKSGTEIIPGGADAV